MADNKNMALNDEAICIFDGMKRHIRQTNNTLNNTFRTKTTF